MEKRYGIFQVDYPTRSKLHPDNRWYVYDYLDGAIARLADGSLAYTRTRHEAQLLVASLVDEPVWTPEKPTYGSLSKFNKAMLSNTAKLGKE
jgi:hypothetical protein